MRSSLQSARDIVFFFFNDTATTEIYTLSLHDALPIFEDAGWPHERAHRGMRAPHRRSEEHTSELQSHSDLVCRLLLEKKNIIARMSSLSVSSRVVSKAIQKASSPAAQRLMSDQAIFSL